MATLLLSAVGGLGWQPSIALTAYSLITVKLLGKHGKSRIINSSTKTKNQVKSRLFLDVVIGEGTSVLKLLSGEDETLLIRGNSFLVLDLGLYVIAVIDTKE
jgi:hypothetical protein